MRCFSFCIAALVLGFAACKEDREIKVYRIAKDNPPPSVSADPHTGVAGMTAGGTMAGGASADPHAGLSAAQLASLASGIGMQVSDSAPAGWKKQPPTALRQLSYYVEGEGGASVDISLVILRGAAGGTLDNVNRWRGQLGLAPVDEAGLKEIAQVVNTPSGNAVAVEIVGLAPGANPAKDGRMVGVIAERGGDGWFFKMRGNSALVAAEKARFLQWVPTVKPADQTEK